MPCCATKRFQLPGPHKEHACFPNIPPPKVIKLMYFTSNMSYIGEISPFSLQKWSTLAGGGIWQNLCLFPHKNRLCYYYVPLNHCIKLKFYAFCVFCFSKLCLLWHFHPKMSNSMLHVMSSIYVQL